MTYKRRIIRVAADFTTGARKWWNSFYKIRNNYYLLKVVYSAKYCPKTRGKIIIFVRNMLMRNVQRDHLIKSCKGFSLRCRKVTPEKTEVEMQKEIVNKENGVIKLNPSNYYLNKVIQENNLWGLKKN